MMEVSTKGGRTEQERERREPDTNSLSEGFTITTGLGTGTCVHGHTHMNCHHRERKLTLNHDRCTIIPRLHQTDQIYVDHCLAGVLSSMRGIDGIEYQSPLTSSLIDGSSLILSRSTTSHTPSTPFYTQFSTWCEVLHYCHTAGEL